MSTSGPMPAGAAGMGSRAAGAGAGRGGTYIYVAGSPRRVRKRRRAVLLFVASLALLAPIGLQIHRTMADHATDMGPFTSGSTVPRQDVAPPVIDDASSKQPPPEPGAIDPPLSRAFVRAQTAALKAGLDLEVTSGFRSVATQQRLYDQAVAKYGSAEIARRWVLPPAESAHVNGLAIDVGPRAAAAWLEKHGVPYGLCRRYVNEWWHFERLAPAIGQQCPSLERYAGE